MATDSSASLLRPLPFDGLGPALQLLRSTRGRSQSDVAQAAGIAQSMLSSYENNRVLPEVASLQKVLVALDARLRDLCRAIEAVQAEQGRLAARRRGEGENASGEVALREIIDRALQLGAVSERGVEALAESLRKPRRR